MVKNKKWFKYTIDYEYGMATLYSKERLEGLGMFYNLASGCFGIRKSIGETKLVDEELVLFKGKDTAVKNSDEQVLKMGMGDHANTMFQAELNTETDIDVPKDKLSKVAYILAHSGDVIVFSNTDFDGSKWKLKSEWGDAWCSCQKEGKPDSTCEVHGE
jgi:hypothetical protein